MDAPLDRPPTDLLGEAADLDDPAAGLRAVTAQRAMAERLERAQVRAALEQGWTWSDIAEALGVSRQAVHKKHARRVRHGG